MNLGDRTAHEERTEALALLPEPYAKALFLRGQGASTDQVAADLEVDPAAVPQLLALAEAKLASLIGEATLRKGLG